MASVSVGASGGNRPPVRVLLADDQPLLRTGFRTVLHAAPGVYVVGEAADGLEAVDLARRLLPDVMLIEVRLPRLDAVAATRALIEAGLPVRVVVLALSDRDEYVDAALAAGASGALVKDLPADQLVSAIHTVAGGAAVVPPRVLRRLALALAPAGDPAYAADPVDDGYATGDGSRAGSARSGGAAQSAFAAVLAGPGGSPLDASRLLTDREREVLVQVAQGLTNAEIAQRLSVSETTVKTHVGRVLTKLGLRDRVQAAVWAYDSGLVRPRRPVT